MTALYEETAAEAAEASALEAIKGLGVSLRGVNDFAGTVDNELFVANLPAATAAVGYGISCYGIAADDQLFLGIGFQFRGANISHRYRSGRSASRRSTSILEAFLQQVSHDTIVHVETRVFANGTASPEDDAG